MEGPYNLDEDREDHPFNTLGAMEEASSAFEYNLRRAVDSNLPLRDSFSLPKGEIKRSSLTELKGMVFYSLNGCISEI